MNTAGKTKVDQSLAEMSAARTQSSLEADAEATPVGTWVEWFSVDGVRKSSTLHFTPDGRVFIIAGPPHGGAGAGTWAPIDQRRFAYRIAERILDPSGEFIGWVDIDHEAVRIGNTFTSTGFSTIYDANDAVVTKVPMEAEGNRIRRL